MSSFTGGSTGVPVGFSDCVGGSLSNDADCHDICMSGTYLIANPKGGRCLSQSVFVFTGINFVAIFPQSLWSGNFRPPRGRIGLHLGLAVPTNLGCPHLLYHGYWRAFSVLKLEHYCEEVFVGSKPIAVAIWITTQLDCFPHKKIL